MNQPWWSYTIVNPLLPGAPAVCTVTREQAKRWVSKQYRPRLNRKVWGPARKLALMEERAKSGHQPGLFGGGTYISRSS